MCTATASSPTTPNEGVPTREETLLTNPNETPHTEGMAATYNQSVYPQPDYQHYSSTGRRINPVTALIVLILALLLVLSATAAHYYQLYLNEKTAVQQGYAVVGTGAGGYYNLYAQQAGRYYSCSVSAQDYDEMGCLLATP